MDGSLAGAQAKQQPQRQVQSGQGRSQRPRQQDYIDYEYIKQRIAEVQRAALAGSSDGAPMPSTDNDASSVRGGALAPPSAALSAASNNDLKALTIRDPSLALLLPLLILLSTLLFLLVFFLVFLIVVRKRRGRGIALQDHEGPLDLSREEEFEGEGGIAGVEERWLEQQDEAVQRGYERAKRESYPTVVRYYCRIIRSDISHLYMLYDEPQSGNNNTFPILWQPT